MRLRYLLTAAVLAVAGFAGAAALSDDSAATRPTTYTTTTNGHTPVTFCHKPGQHNQREQTTDDDGFLQGHLGHGDTLGKCPTPPDTTTIETDPPNPCDTPAADQYEECNPPPPTTTETQPPGDCPPGMVHEKGHDGNEGNDDCCFPGVDCDGDTPPPTNSTTTTVTEPPSTTTQPPPVVTEPEPTVDEPGTVSENPPSVTVKPKPPKVHSATCKAPAYMLKGTCVRDFKGKPHPVQRGSG